MASEVDIGNTAVGRLGEDALIQSFTDGSALATHCQRFYPIARDSLLEQYDWNFATTRIKLAALNLISPNEWTYTYAWPTDAVRAVNVFPPDLNTAAGGYTATPSNPAYSNISPNLEGPFGGFAQFRHTDDQPYEVETRQDTGDRVIFTNQPNAVLRYTRQITDPSKFSPLFTDILGWYLASYLAGPVIKGSTGMQVGMSMLKVALGMLPTAQNSDAGQRMQRNSDRMNPAPWLAGRS